MSPMIKKKIISALTVAFIFISLPALMEFTGYHTNRFFLERKDAEYFFYYEDILVTKHVFSKDEPLKFLSISDVYKKVDFYYSDTLRCDLDYDEIGYFNFGTQTGEKKGAQPRLAVETDSPWVWEGTKPQNPATCYMEAVVTADVGYDVEKTQTVNSVTFRIE